MSLFYLGVLKSFFSKDVNGRFPSLPSSQGGWGVLCVNVSSAAWSLEAQGKGVAGNGSLVILAFPFFSLFLFLSFSFLFTFEGWVELR